MTVASPKSDVASVIISHCPIEFTLPILHTSPQQLQRLVQVQGKEINRSHARIIVLMEALGSVREAEMVARARPQLR